MTKTDICNFALDLIGQDPINDALLDPSAWAKRFRRLYEVAARKILVAHEWNEAIETILLTYESNDDNLYNAVWEYIYDLPSNCLDALDINHTDEEKRLVLGSYLYANINEPTNEKLTVASTTSSTIVCVEDIDADVIAVNKVRVLIDATEDEYKTYSYTSWANKTFSGVTPDPTADVTAGDEVDSPSDGVAFRYIKDIRAEVSSVVVYGDHIGWAIARELAVMFAPSAEKSSADIKTLEGFAEEALYDAQNSDSGEQHSPTDGEEMWTDQ